MKYIDAEELKELIKPYYVYAKSCLRLSQTSEDYAKYNKEVNTYEFVFRKINYLQQKPAECIEDSVEFKEGFKAGRESGLRDGQKYVLNNLDSYGLCKSAEWSEEDRKILNTIISDGSRGVEFDAKQVNFLKSLCPQYRWKPSEQEKGALRTAIYILTNERNFPKAAAHLQNILDAFGGEEPCKEWKPSEEQMVALKEACDEHWEPDGIDPLYTLYQDLKKL